MNRTTGAWDATDLCASLRTPVLVVQRRDAALPDLPQVEALVAALPNAALRVLPGDAVFPALGEAPEAASVIASFLDSQAPPTPAELSRGAPALSNREREVLAAVARGKRNAEIAEALVISPATVTRHISNILGKTGCANRAELVRYAMERGLGGDP